MHSPSRICRLFSLNALGREILSISSTLILAGLLTKKGVTLLLDTDMSIDEISIAIGYLNTSSFRRKFKQETGMTPSQFRVNKNL